MNTCTHDSCYADGQYQLPPLPYAPSDLEPFLDAETLRLHHDKHHAAYVKGANTATLAMKAMARGERSAEDAASVAQNLAFHLGGHLLHCLYWKNLSPVPQALPEGPLAEAIVLTYGSFEGFARLFRAVALGVQGSGWCVLGVEPIGKQLTINAILRHQEALSPRFCPLLVCDVWEHAYYLRYQHDRAAYVDAFMRHINWEIVAHRYSYCNPFCRHEKH